MSRAQANATTDYLRTSLVHMVRTDPSITACMARLTNACLCNAIEFREQGKRVNGELAAVLNTQFRIFFKSAVEAMFFCGFVPFVVRRHNGINTPLVLPLGSYAWSVKATDRKKQARLNALMTYDVRPIDIEVDASEILVYEVTPACQYSPDLLSPMRELLKHYLLVQHSMECSQTAFEWNKRKHIAISEKIELKDQTTSGIQLLDDFRRYSLTGAHNLTREGGIMRIRTRDNKRLSSMTEASHHWIKDQFEAGDTSASTHILPPNMTATELTNIDIGEQHARTRETFTAAVNLFFDAPDTSQLMDVSTVRSGEQINRNQYLNILNVCATLESLGAFAYAKCFDIEPAQCAVGIMPQTRLELNTAADIKALAEANVLQAADLGKIRNLYVASK